MSGGHFNYYQNRISDIIDSIEDVLASTDTEYQFNDETTAVFIDAVKCLRKAFIYAHRIDWLLSGDDGEDEFHRRLKQQLEAPK